MTDREPRLDELSLLDLESALGEFDEGGWHGVKRRRAIIAAARAWLESPTTEEPTEAEVEAAFRAWWKYAESFPGEPVARDAWRAALVAARRSRETDSE